VGRVVEEASTRKAVAAAAIGNATEWYDFGVYSYLAVTIGRVFYPSASPGTQVIATFTTFAAAFLVRPLGGLFFGPLGDRIGRKQVLAVTMLMMALGTVAIALIPSHAAIGIAAPVLLLAARMVQGFSTGGEYGGATTFITEYAPDDRRGALSSWLEFGTNCGYLAGAIVVTALSVLLDADQMTGWGWRVPFVLALPLGMAGLYLRLRLEDTPAFRDQQQTSGKPERKGQLRRILSTQWRSMLLCVGLVLVFNVNVYMLTGFLPTYLEELGYGSTRSLLVSLVAVATVLVLVRQVGRVSDRLGRRPVLMSGSIATVVVALPAFWLLQRGEAAAVAGTVLLALALVHFSGAVPASLPAFFPTAYRYGALAISFNVSVSLFGGTTPLVSEALISATGSRYAPAALLVAAGVVGIVTVSRMRESANRPLPGTRPVVSAASAGTPAS
jgi:MHS family proline/betaine transporter-like MFS transporter